MDSIELSKHQQYDKERKTESICDQCGLKMKAERHKRKFKYAKAVVIYNCSCGNRFRERTQSEILRDIGVKF
jgi:C4-type Zn-finger protein